MYMGNDDAETIFVNAKIVMHKSIILCTLYKLFVCTIVLALAPTYVNSELLLQNSISLTENLERK